MGIKDYSTTAADNDTAGSVNFAEGQLPSTVNNSCRQVMADIRESYDTDWRDWGHTPTYASSTTFTIATDVTAIYHAGRKLKLTDATTLYDVVASSSYSSPNTTVTVTTGGLSGSLTAVALGLESTNDAVPSKFVTKTGTETLTNKTLTSPVISTISNTGTVTLPTSTDTLVGKATTDTLTNKTINLTSNTLTGTTAQFNTALSDGNFVTLAGTETLTNKTFTSPTINDPALNTVSTETTSVKLGTGALASINTGASRYSTAIGRNALNSMTTGAYNVAVGYLAAEFNVIGIGQTAIGYGALNASTSNYNTAIGYDAARLTTSGIVVAVGKNACLSNTTGAGVTGIGSGALSSATGDQNTALGYSAGSNVTSGANNTCLGYDTSASSATVSNEITLGNSSVATLRCQVTSITSLSDERDKANILPLKPGLAFIERLEPVSFVWNMRDGGKVGIADTGFIAQALKAAQTTGETIPGLVYEENPEKLEAAYGKLIPVLVKAIQELSARVKELENGS